MTEDRKSYLQQWLDLAREDLEVAMLLISDKHAFRNQACFHIQQSIEKYFKALLVAHGIDFAKTHNVVRLREQCAEVAPDLRKLDLEPVFDYAVRTRYPDDMVPIDAAECRTALELGQQVQTHILSLLESILQDTPGTGQ